MNTHDIDVELPPLPVPGEAMSKWAYDEFDMEAYGKVCWNAAIEAERKRRGEPVAEIVLGEDGIQIETIAGSPLRLGDKLYSAPQPAEPMSIEEFDELIDVYQAAQKDGTQGERANARLALRVAFLSAKSQPAEPVYGRSSKTFIPPQKMDPWYEEGTTEVFDHAQRQAYVDGWNACRVAFLKGLQGSN